MTDSINHPLAFFVLSLVIMSFALWMGKFLSRKTRPLGTEAREDLGVIQAAALTLLGLMIGFTFSMALNHYDRRGTLEEEEANAIGVEYLRIDLLPDSDAAKARALLLNYLDQRVLFYTTRDEEALRQINTQTAKLQGELWSVIRTAAVANPGPVIALTVSGMNDILKTQGYTQAAWSSGIPVTGWGLMLAIAICSTFLVGFGMRIDHSKFTLLLVLPFIVSIAFFLIADVDIPRRGIIKVGPQNLLILSESLHGQ